MYVLSSMSCNDNSVSYSNKVVVVVVVVVVIIVVEVRITLVTRHCKLKLEFLFRVAFMENSTQSLI